MLNKICSVSSWPYCQLCMTCSKRLSNIVLTKDEEDNIVVCSEKHSIIYTDTLVEKSKVRCSHFILEKEEKSS